MSTRRRNVTLVIFLSAAGAATAQPAATGPEHESRGAVVRTVVAFPHPLITEVLYDVPRGAEGDADQDGQREATGDEFVELVNPHDKPISLKGYVLIDAERAEESKGQEKSGGSSPKSGPEKTGEKGSEVNPNKKRDKGSGDGRSNGKSHSREESQVRFVFPEMTLEPGQTVVVFNGLNSKIAGPSGGTDRAPTGPNEKFAGAFVLSMRNTSKFAGFSNTADSVSLIAPDSTVVECVVWGEGIKVPPGAKLVTKNGLGRGSLARRFADGAWSRDFTDHVSLPGAESSSLFSPGRSK